MTAGTIDSIIKALLLVTTFMQVPIRKKETYIKPKPDPYLTEGKFSELKNKLERMKATHPKLSSEVKRLAEMGDFSENAGYQDAKGRLRGLNQRILELEAHLKTSIIFKPSAQIDFVCLGSKITVTNSEQKKIYTIVGSTETDPARGFISHHSPIGSALMGHKVDDIINFTINDQAKILKIIKIE